VGETGYFCKNCHAEATMTENGLVRGCQCNSTIIASLEATAYGESHCSEQPLKQKLFDFFHQIGLETLKRLKNGV